MPKPMYLELLKCLNLYSQQIIDRSELLTLVHDLKRTQIELFSNFRLLLGYSGGDPGCGDARDASTDNRTLRDQGKHAEVKQERLVELPLFERETRTRRGRRLAGRRPRTRIFPSGNSLSRHQPVSRVSTRTIVRVVSGKSCNVLF